MAVQNSGTKSRSNNPDPPMVDQSRGYDARSGAPKRVQANVATKWGMHDKNPEVGVTAGLNPMTGVWADPPDASSPNVMDPEPKGKNLRRQAQILQTTHGMRGASDGMTPSQSDGNTLEANIGGKVLGEAILSGSTNLPKATAENTDSGKSPGLNQYDSGVKAPGIGGSNG